MLNASNFARNLHVNAVVNGLVPATVGNRKARRRANAIERQARSSGYLDRLNDIEVQADRHLHPTKGWRHINPKRTIASTIVEMARKGFLGSLQDMKEDISNA